MERAVSLLGGFRSIQAACCSRSLRLARRGRCETLLFDGLLQLLPQVASWAAQGERSLPRPLISSVLLRSWLLLMAASEHVSCSMAAVLCVHRRPPVASSPRLEVGTRVA